MDRIIKRILLIIIFLLTLPVLLFIYQPSMQLGGFGLLLGSIGYTITPIIIFIVLILFIKDRWN